MLYFKLLVYSNFVELDLKKKAIIKMQIKKNPGLQDLYI